MDPEGGGGTIHARVEKEVRCFAESPQAKEFSSSGNSTKKWF